MRKARAPSRPSRESPANFPLAILAVGLWAYHNSVTGAFVLDDIPQLVENPHIRHLWPLGDVLFGRLGERPLVNLSFALNYAFGGLDVRGYHVVNLAIHLVAALVLYGLVRRTLTTPRLQPRWGQAAPWLALTVALLWIVHPVQTNSVMYLIQRAESLMGLWYLLTLYSLVRGWGVAAIVSCALGMASKPVMVTAPLAAFLYDGVFLAGSARAAWQRRRPLYVGLAATWGLLAALVVNVSPHAEPSAGFALTGITPLAYARTQPGVILHYLRLAVWPHPLVLDYGWPLAATPQAVWPPTLALGALVFATAWTMVRAPTIGFWGAWCFLLLAPTSSVIPLKDLAFEHRMYVPLASLLVLLVLGGDALLRRGIADTRRRRLVACWLVTGVVATLGTVTIRRNRDYRSKGAMWRDIVAKRPANPRGHVGVGAALLEEGKLDAAAAAFSQTLRLYPDDAAAHYSLGTVLSDQGKSDEAMAQFTEALRLYPGYAKAHNNLGVALFRQGKLADAIAHYTEALRLMPDYAQAQRNLTEALANQTE